jgi:hypothetical protein
VLDISGLMWFLLCLFLRWLSVSSTFRLVVLRSEKVRSLIRLFVGMVLCGVFFLASSALSARSEPFVALLGRGRRLYSEHRIIGTFGYLDRCGMWRASPAVSAPKGVFGRVGVSVCLIRWAVFVPFFSVLWSFWYHPPFLVCCRVADSSFYIASISRCF